jgi:hypothetical protein
MRHFKNYGTEGSRKKLMGVSLEARSREGDWEKFGMGGN